MFDLTGRKALITGATGGIGEAIARALHAQGATVGLHGTRQEKLEELAASLGDRCVVLPADLADRDGHSDEDFVSRRLASRLSEQGFVRSSDVGQGFGR